MMAGTHDHKRQEPRGPAAAGVAAGHYPGPPVTAGHVAGAPRRIRGLVGGQWLFDTTKGLYVWEHPYYPQYYIPGADVDEARLHDTGDTVSDSRGLHGVHALVRPERQERARRVLRSDNDVLVGAWRFDWHLLDHWFEEDEEIFVHPRNPYVRVDALATSRPVRVEAGGTVLAQTPWAFVVFETSLPPRYYLPKPSIDWTVLSPSPTVTRCPYKGTTSTYWDAHIDGTTIEDVAWSYDFPTRHLLPIAGLVAFYDDKVDVHVGRPSGAGTDGSEGGG
jgi:uncharacterized protein (DUF427 family)